MDEKTILKHLDTMCRHLERVSALVDENKWDDVKTTLAQVRKMDDKIQAQKEAVENFKAQNSSFKKQYSDVKEKLLKQANESKDAIQGWITGTTGKISDSKNVLDNISKYYSPGKTSYYIDKKE